MTQGNPNPSPETRFGGSKANKQSPGGWKKEDSISYQYEKLMRMTETGIDKWVKKDGKKTIAQILAYKAIKRAHRSLPDLKEITDRTEGKALQSMDHTTKGKEISWGWKTEES